MPLKTVPFGRAALTALTEAVTAAKAGDPLAPVQVVVPTEPVGVAARRWLARHGTSGAAGIAGISVVTLYRLAEMIAAPAMAGAGRRPATAPVLVSAVRGALALDPGQFTDVADHPQTAQALAAASRELRTLEPELLQVIAERRPVTGDVVRLHHEVRARLADGYYDEVALQAAATRELAGTALPPTVVFLPEALTPGAQRFVGALAAAAPVTAVVGVTGLAADRRVLSGVAGALGLAEPSLTPPPEPLGDRVICTTDADDEVRAVVSLVAQRMAAGVPGHRIGIIYPTAVPYARLLHEQLAAAGVERYGRGVKPAAERTYGRAVRGLLALPDRDFRRADVMAWLADAPVAGARPQRWDRLSRQAGIVASADWSARLQALVRRRRADADEYEGSDQPDRAQWARADAEAAQGLEDFVVCLRSELAAIAGASSWTSLAKELITLWERLFPTARGDAEEAKAHSVVLTTLRSLNGLEPVAGPPSLSVVREIIEFDLRSELSRVGDIGAGVMVGPIPDAVGQEFELLCVVGMAEGTLPPTSADDPLLPESVRELTGGVLPTWRDRQDAQHRALIAALAGSQETVLTFPRGDIRTGSARVPSRWLLPTLRHFLGPVQATDWHRQTHPSVHVRESYSAGILEQDPVTNTQYRQREALWNPAVVDPVPVQMLQDRADGVFSRFTGLVGPQPPLPDLGPSPTALQAWFQCPHHYFVRYVLGVRELDDPDEAIEMSAVDQGSLMHRVLERLVLAWRDPGFGQPWPPEMVARLDEIIDEEFAEAQATGIVGLRTPWHNTKRRLRRDLRNWIAQDNALRAGRWKPLRAELTFDALPVPLPGGETLLLRGSADRVDIDAAGNLRVLDYKSGSARKYKDLSAADPTLSGRFLQLPLYALAAGAGPGPTRADFWFISQSAGGEVVGYEVTDDVLARATAVIEVAVNGHRAGLFPPRPRAHSGGYDCPSCQADGHEERMSKETFESLLGHPLLAAYREVIA